LHPGHLANQTHTPVINLPSILLHKSSLE
jgi:hypothetical protein